MLTRASVRYLGEKPALGADHVDSGYVAVNEVGKPYTPEGVLLFVKVNGREPIDTVVNIQGHRIRFLSVDLTGEPEQIRQCWRRCLSSDNP